ncbi:Flp family type IVb pilin [Aureimonas sp. AU40]|uniref:Flp family type IVb pilin n=1 Tax=Aureimonas sp. AU40 TaxID=1637747 RepID=UPI000B07D3E3|nr:Flp family type IVb pilin [Aureimonas sp. AU40]
MSALGRRIRRGMGDVRGTTAIEYALLASLIAMAIIGGVSATGQSIGGMMDGVFAKISTALASE